jgi:hypothetical protein
MEGSSGNYSYYFENDSLAAGKEDNSYNTYDESIIFCRGLKPYPGLISTTGENESDPVYLTEPDFLTKNRDALNEYQQLITRISSNSDEAVTQNGYSKIHIENVVNYGEDHTETEDFELDAPLFEALFH